MTTTDEDRLLADAEALNRQYMEAEAFERKQHEHRVDLKWSLWTEGMEYWEEYAPKTLAALKSGIDDGEMLEHGGYIRILTAPRKEIRSGEAVIYARDGHVMADVRFSTEWDEPYVLVETLMQLCELPEVSEEEYDARVERLRCQELGCTEEEHVDFGEDPTLADVLARIDAVEERLLVNDKLAWESFIEWAKEEFGPQTTTKEN